MAGPAAQGQSPNGTYCYLYGITAAGVPRDWGPLGLGDPPARVYTIEESGLAAVVSDTPEQVADPTAEHAMAHERCVARIMSGATIIPCSFGSVVSRPFLSRLLASTRAECLRLLALFEGTMEVGLRIFWRKDRFLADIETPEIARLTRKASELELGELLAAAADARRQHYHSAIFAPLAAAARSAHLGEVLNPRMVLNAAFLVEKSREEPFDTLVNKVCGPWRDRLDFHYSGPWPPYHFVTLRIQLEGKDPDDGAD